MSRRIVTTPDGVYLPPPIGIEALAAGVTAGLLVIGAALGRLALAQTGLFAALLVALVVVRIVTIRRRGPLGLALVRVEGGSLTVARPQDTRGAVTVALAEVEHLTVYGRSGHRRVRFALRGGGQLEVTPMWPSGVEPVIADFLRSLPVRVVIEDPQTLLAAVRGDGPASD